MTSHPAHNFALQLMRDFGHHEVAARKWEFLSNGRRRSRTICITLHAGGTDLTIAHRAVGTDGRMNELHSFTCDLDCLPQLVLALNRALAVAQSMGSSNKHQSDRRRQPKQNPIEQTTNPIQPNRRGQMGQDIATRDDSFAVSERGGTNSLCRCCQQSMPTRYGPRPRPDFEIVDWRGGTSAGPTQPPQKIERQAEDADEGDASFGNDLNDQIPW
jgi:hypothetical protein